MSVIALHMDIANLIISGIDMASVQFPKLRQTSGLDHRLLIKLQNEMRIVLKRVALPPMFYTRIRFHETKTLMLRIDLEQRREH